MLKFSGCSYVRILVLCYVCETTVAVAAFAAWKKW